MFVFVPAPANQLASCGAATREEGTAKVDRQTGAELGSGLGSSTHDLTTEAGHFIWGYMFCVCARCAAHSGFKRYSPQSKVQGCSAKRS